MHEELGSWGLTLADGGDVIRLYPMVHLKAVQNEGVVRNKKVLRAKVNEEVIVAMERPGCTRPMTSVMLWTTHKEEERRQAVLT